MPGVTFVCHVRRLRNLLGTVVGFKHGENMPLNFVLVSLRFKVSRHNAKVEE
jgi:hypothetical protein